MFRLCEREQVIRRDEWVGVRKWLVVRRGCALDHRQRCGCEAVDFPLLPQKIPSKFHRKTATRPSGGGVCLVKFLLAVETSGDRKIHSSGLNTHTWHPHALRHHRHSLVTTSFTKIASATSVDGCELAPTNRRAQSPHSSICLLSDKSGPPHFPTPIIITMKFFFALAAAAVAVASVSADSCDVTKLLPLLQDANVKKCSSDTGFSPPTPPDAATLPKLCNNSACKAALATLNGLGLGDCTVGTTRLITDLTGPIQAFCDKQAPAPAPVPAPATTTVAPSTPSAPGTTPSATPAPATTKPVC